MTPPPRYTCRWAAEHPAEFLELCKPPAECPVCLRDFDEASPALGPIQGDETTSCRHFACQDCWCTMSQERPPWHCPLCRVDITEWVANVTHWNGECVDWADVRLFVELATFALEARHMVPELRELGARLLRHLP